MAKVITIQIPDEIEAAIISLGTDCTSYFNQQLVTLVDRHRESLKNQAIADSADTITTNVEAVEAAISVIEEDVV